MLLVQAYPAHVRVRGSVDEQDAVRLLNDLHQELLVDERHWHGPTLVGRVPVGDARDRHFAELFHDIRCPGLQDRIGIVAD